MSAFGWYRPWLTDAQASDLTSKAKSVAAALATTERDGIVTETAGNLGRLTSLNEKTVRAALAELAAEGWSTSHRGRDHLRITLIPRSVTTPDQVTEIGHHARSRTGTTPAQNGSDARSRSGTTPDTPTRATTTNEPPSIPPLRGGKRKTSLAHDQEVIHDVVERLGLTSPEAADAVKGALAVLKSPSYKLPNPTDDDVLAVLEEWAPHALEGRRHLAVAA